MSSKRIRRTAPRKTQQNAKEKAYYLERCHYSYEHMLHMMFCDPEFDLHCRKSKQICVLSYCMYYYGITVQQLCATGITPAAKPECELVFLNRLVREDVLEVDKSIQPGENQNVYFLTQKGADFVEQRLNALSGTPVAGKHIDKNAVHEIRKRFDSFTAPTNISHFVAARDLHAFMLSSVKDTRFHFQSEVGMGPDGIVLDLHEKILALQSNRLHEGTVFFSDALFTRSSITDGVPQISRAQISSDENTNEEDSERNNSKEKEPESSQGHDRNTDTGSPGSSGNTDGKNHRLIGADAIDAPDNMWVPGMAAYPDQTCYTYIEQDMSTQRLNVISGKLNAYMNTAASHAKHPALHTLLFTLQTKLTKSDLKSLKKPYRESTATGSSSDSNIDTSIDSGYGFPSGRQMPGSSARGRFNRFQSNKPMPELKRSAWRERDAMIAVPGICITKYGSAWREATLSDVADLCSVVSRECEEYPLYYENLASHLLELAKQSSDLTIGEYLSYVWEMRRLSGSPDANPQTVAGNRLHAKRYIARRETIEHAIDGIPDLHKMFKAGFSVCTAPNRDLGSVVPYLMPNVCFDLPEIMRGFAINYFPMENSREDVPVYSSYQDDPKLSLSFRNRLTWEDGTNAFVENISDDFGGYDRVKGYLDYMSWNGGKGYLICLLSDTDTETLKKLAKCKYYIRVDETSYPSDEATGNGQNISPSSSPLSSDQGTGKTRREGKSLKHDLPLRVVFCTYSMFENSAGLFEINRSGKRTNLPLNL